MAAYQGGTPVTPSGPSFMAPGFGPLPTEFVPPPGSFPPGYMWWTKPGFGMKNLPILLHDVFEDGLSSMPELGVQRL